MTIQALDLPLGVNPCCGKAGIMLREKLDRNSRYVMTALRTNGLLRQRRDDATDPNDNETSGGPFDSDALRAAVKKGLFLRVEREGDVIRTLYSLDGSTFEPIDDPFRLPGLAKDVEIGVAIGARDRDEPIQNRLSEFQFKIID